MQIQERPDYEGLKNYIFTGKRRPVDVPTPTSRPRLNTQPGRDVPAVTPIPTSSQRPSKATNATIPYARMVNSVPGVDVSDIFPGDLVFVHRTANATGTNHNRTNKIMSIRQLNAELDKAQVGHSALGAGMQSQILAVREHHLRGYKDRLDAIEMEYDYCRRSNITGYTRSLKDGYDVLKEAFPYVKQLVDDVTSGKARFSKAIDWRAVTMLRDWVPDGFMLSRDDDEHNNDELTPLSRNQGVCVNVAVGGVATVRNTNDVHPQQFDTEFMVRDSLLLLLVANQPDPTNSVWTFRYHTTTHRVIEELFRMFTYNNTASTKYPNEGGISLEDLRNTVAIWKVATLMDTKSVSAGFGREGKVTVNVAIEEFDWYAFLSYLGYMDAASDLEPLLESFNLHGSWALTLPSHTSSIAAASGTDVAARPMGMFSSVLKHVVSRV